jgi:FkbM family methyltransferase
MEGDWKVFEIGGFRLFWPSQYEDRELPWLYNEVFESASKNPHAYEIGLISIKPGDWVVDAGACEGFFTRYALQRGAKILVIEPVPLLAQALSRTFEQEIRTGHVRLLQGGLGRIAGRQHLEIFPDKIYNATIGPRGTEPVEIYTLDSLLEDGIVPTIDFVKMDIEGFEMAAVEGGSKLFRKHSPKLALAVYHSFPNAQIIRSLLLAAQPAYQISWRGIFFEVGRGRPRPYMLHARV